MTKMTQSQRKNADLIISSHAIDRAVERINISRKQAEYYLKESFKDSKEVQNNRVGRAFINQEQRIKMIMTEDLKEMTTIYEYMDHTGGDFISNPLIRKNIKERFEELSRTYKRDSILASIETSKARLDLDYLNLRLHDGVVDLIKRELTEKIRLKKLEIERLENKEFELKNKLRIHHTEYRYIIGEELD